jgi:hypothetical protein
MIRMDSLSETESQTPDLSTRHVAGVFSMMYILSLQFFTVHITTMSFTGSSAYINE